MPSTLLPSILRRGWPWVVLLVTVALAVGCNGCLGAQPVQPYVPPRVDLASVVHVVEDRATVAVAAANRGALVRIGTELGQEAAQRQATLGVERARAVAAIIADPPLPPRPRRVLLVGSSSMEHGISGAIADGLRQFGDVHVRNEGLRSTGLSRQDYYDWNTNSRLFAQQYQPDLVVAQFGGNDCQGAVNPDGSLAARWGTPEWDQVYGDRLRVFVNDMREVGATVVLMGFPTMREERFRQRIDHLNEVTRLTAEELRVPFVSIRELTSDENGEYIETAVIDGIERGLRSPDGVHLSTQGSRLVGRHAVRIIGQHMNLTRERPLGPRDEMDIITERQNRAPERRRPAEGSGEGSGVAADGESDGDELPPMNDDDSDAPASP